MKAISLLMEYQAAEESTLESLDSRESGPLENCNWVPPPPEW